MLQLQQQHSFESIQNIKRPLSFILSLVLYFPNYSICCLYQPYVWITCCSCCSSTAATAAVPFRINSNCQIMRVYQVWWWWMNYFSNYSICCLFLSGKSTAAAAEILQQQHPFESKQNVKLPLYTKFGENKWITSRIIQFAAFTSLMSGKSAPAAAAVLQLQQQWPFESIQIIKLPMCTKFGDNI